MEILSELGIKSCPGNLGKVHVANFPGNRGKVHASEGYKHTPIQGRFLVSLHAPVWTWEIHKKS